MHSAANSSEFGHYILNPLGRERLLLGILLQVGSGRSGRCQAVPEILLEGIGRAEPALRSTRCAKCELRRRRRPEQLRP
jgi:hypothetical protein